MSRDSATVSNNMRKIHSKDTSIELLLRKALWHKGYRYRKNYKALPGSPDIVLTKYKIAIFAIVNFFTERIGRFSNSDLKMGKIQTFGSKKSNETVIVIMKMIKSFYFQAILSFTSGDKTFPNIQMNVYKPLKKPFGIQNFLIQPLYLDDQTTLLQQGKLRRLILMIVILCSCCLFSLMNIQTQNILNLIIENRNYIC